MGILSLFQGDSYGKDPSLQMSDVMKHLSVSRYEDDLGSDVEKSLYNLRWDLIFSTGSGQN